MQLINHFKIRQKSNTEGRYKQTELNARNKMEFKFFCGAIVCNDRGVLPLRSKIYDFVTSSQMQLSHWYPWEQTVNPTAGKIFAKNMTAPNPYVASHFTARYRISLL